MERYAVILLAMIMTATFAKAQQVEVSGGMLTSSKFKDSEHNDYGKGSMQQYNIKYTQSLSTRLSEDGRPIAWSATFASSYDRIDNSDMAAQYNPGEILNASLTVSHLRPISARWSIIASLGAGIYSAPKEICWSSVLFNGACISVYKASDAVSLGGGVGLTNAYGAPMVVPMAYLRWTTSGRTTLDLTVVNGIKAVAAHKFTTRFSLAWNILDMNALMSTVKVDDKHKIYSSMMLRSFLQPTLRLGKKSSVCLSAGTNLVRTRKLTDRSIKYMFKPTRHADKRHFTPSAYFALGYKYGF